MLYFDKQTPQWRIAIWHVTEDLPTLLAMLPDSETVQCEAQQKFRALPRTIEWVAVRVLLCKMLQRQVPILYHDNGAPYLPDYEHLDISISHTHGYVAVALAEQGYVGIDIEQISNKVERVKQKFVGEDEAPKDLNQLILHWSAKETAFKMMHRNKVDFKKHLHIQPFEQAEEGTFLLTETRTDKEQQMTIYFKLFPEFVLTYSFLEETD